MTPADFYLIHPVWFWIALGGLLLAVEVALSTEQLLWPAGSAGVVAVLLIVGVPIPTGVDFALFAVLTIASTMLARRYLRRPPADPDVNDPSGRMVGKTGQAVAAFVGGVGRVFVDGKEWAAEAETDLAPGARVEVAAVLDGGRLKVRGTG